MGLITAPDRAVCVTSWKVRLVRVVAVALGLAAWFGTQRLISERAPGYGVIGDGIHDLTAPVHCYFVEHPDAADRLLIISSAGIDLLAVFLLAWSILGPSLRPFLGLLVLFALRQICQAVCALPTPDGMIWRSPGFPSLLVTYDVTNDLFFSGHTGLAVYGTIELCRLRRPWLTVLAILLVVFETVTVLVLRAHYTMDVFAGITAAFCAAIAASRLAPPCDRLVARLVGAAARQAFPEGRG
jgi:PAP2 superfamily protein